MQFGDELDDEGLEGVSLRNNLEVELKDQEKLIASSGTLLGYRYEGSSIVISDDTPPPKDNPRIYIPTARPGHRAPHIWLEEGVSLLDKFGRGFTLLNFGKTNTDFAPIEEAAESIKLPLEILEIDDMSSAILYERRFVMIRPDLMVAWRGNSLPDDLYQFLNILRGETDDFV
ncbi:hypothetical protein OAJ93_03520 [Gammaproteobacteria bacterium]|nr:hypothetical protein [Gammaproteobacteria bacterium]